MLIEHSFVTTRPGPEVLAAIGSLLAALGFDIGNDASGQAISGVKGGKRGNSSTRISRLPQSIRVEFDRGRISIAGSVEVSGKEVLEHEAFLLSLVDTIQRRVVAGEPEEALARQFKEMQSQVDKRGRMVRAAGTGCLVFLGLALLGLVILVVSNFA